MPQVLISDWKCSLRVVLSPRDTPDQQLPIGGPQTTGAPGGLKGWRPLLLTTLGKHPAILKGSAPHILSFQGLHLESLVLPVRFAVCAVDLLQGAGGCMLLRDGTAPQAG